MHGYCEAWLCHKLLLWAHDLTPLSLNLTERALHEFRCHSVNNRTVNSYSLNFKDYLLLQMTKVPSWSCSKSSRFGNLGVHGIPPGWVPSILLSATLDCPAVTKFKAAPAQETKSSRRDAFSSWSVFFKNERPFPRRTPGDF